MIKNLIISFIILTAIEFLNFSFLGPDLIKILQIIGVGLLPIILLLHLVLKQELDFKMRFRSEILLIFFGLVLSMFMAQWAHGQSLSITFIAQRFMYFYLLYWALHEIKPSIESIERIIVVVAITYSIAYFIQYFAYPTILFDVRIAEDRGTIRIFLSGFAFLVIAYFLLLNRLFNDFKISTLILLLIFFSTFILLGTRQILFTMILLTMMNLLFSQKSKSKIFTFFLIIGSLFPIYLIFQDVFISLIELSKQQSESIVENVRVRAAYFFLTELFPNTMAYLTGNGADSSNSFYGLQIQMYRDIYGFHQSDVGIIGDYTKFGLLFIVGVFMILYKVIASKISNQYLYVKYFYLSILFTLFTGGGAFAQSDSIVVICISLYLLDVDRNDRTFKQWLENSMIENEEENIIEVNSFKPF